MSMQDPALADDEGGLDEDGFGEMDVDEEEEVDNGNENESVDDEEQSESPPETYPKQRYHTPKIFQDAITVLIPLDVTADLKIAIKKTRAKRIASIYKRFPTLKPKKPDEGNASDDPMLDEDDEEKDKDQQPPAKKKKKLENVPQPEQFGSVLDYLEAKYVKGVMLEEDEDNAPILDDDKSEGQGSVYSKDSFLDDTDLQRDVAEQVMASTTLTKLELEHEDGDFFVNVGNLEVENDDYGENYDPLQDKENKTAKKKKKKPSTSTTTTTKAAVTPKSKKKTEPPAKKKEPTSAKSKKSTSSATSTKSKKQTPEEKALKLTAKKAKSTADSLFKKAAAMIKKLTSENLPKLKTKMKVALVCPKNKGPGDNITFANPHYPGQKLKVTVPKSCFAGGTFKVTVPVKQSREGEKDGNKLPRDLQEALDVYGKAYDEWCTAQSKVDSSFETFKEKQAKFDKLAALFPKNLVTPIDPIYLKQVVRRARQNKYKRSKTAAAAAKRETATPTKKDEPAEEPQAEDESEEEEEEKEEEPKNLRTIDMPTRGSIFAERKFSTTANDFITPE